MLTKNEMLDNFAHNIEEERKSLDFTQVLFSKMLGVSVSTYKNIVSRKTNNLDVFLALRLSELTHKSIPDLLGYSSKEYEVLGKYRQLTDRQRAYILGKMDYEISMKVLETDPENMLDVL